MKTGLYQGNPSRARLLFIAEQPGMARPVVPQLRAQLLWLKLLLRSLAEAYRCQPL